MNDHRQALRLSIERLSHSKLATALTMIVIAIALALPTSFFSATHYLQSIAGTWHQQVQVSLYLQQGLNQDAEQQLLRQLTTNPAVERVKLISAEEGLRDFQQQTGFAEVISQLPQNPLPAVIEVIPTQIAGQPQQVERLVRQLKQLPGVDIAQLDRDWVQRLFSLVNLIDRISVVLGFALAIAVLLTIGNTLRLILKKYQKEIELMNLLGAKKRYIRRPYLYTGCLYGLGGAVLAWLLLAVALLCLHGPLQQLASIYHLPMRFDVLPIGILPELLFAGVLLGTTGAWLAVNTDLDAA